MGASMLRAGLFDRRQSKSQGPPIHKGQSFAANKALRRQRRIGKLGKSHKVRRAPSTTLRGRFLRFPLPIEPGITPGTLRQL